ncbi:cytochrome c3 family protein [Trichloromonas sp.]|uniref:cytochrome c3 family protein n=1 Tax=Trichloromonas sp. TaxID=3069249 RepID=UPI003D8139AD
MKKLKLILTFLLGGILLAGSLGWAESKVRVIPRDCIDCHDDEGKALAARGAAHQEVGCRGCHPGHPLEGRKPASDCSECHAPGASPHYRLSTCTSCHNPHKPLDVDFTGLTSAKTVCLSCHADPITADAGVTNPHAELGCNECHLTHHDIPQCSNCHEPHAKSMVQKDCLGCHPAHSPKSVKLDTAQPATLCASCHKDIVRSIQQAGGAHRDMGSCAECHKQHPPQQGKRPVCADCHAAKAQAHFAVKGCATCHDPHAPLAKSLADMKNVRAACVSCHAGPGQQMQKTPSAHAKLECNKCHLKHGEAMSCLDCHKPHNETMSYRDCLGCHAPHAPAAAAIRTDVPASACAVCHAETVNTFTASGAAHKESLASCGECHPQHGQAKSCLDCHQPHSKSMADKDCLACHAPHAPAEVRYGAAVAPALCGACHDEAVAAIAKQGGAHQEVGCAGCHEQHGAVPACAGCHAADERPHFAIGNCSDCHAPHAPLGTALADMKEPRRACASCHGGVVEEFTRNGGAHQAGVACQECHQQHPGKGEKARVDCGLCHASGDKPHYALKDCASCHHAHRPLQLDFAKAGAIREACLSCHEGAVPIEKEIPNPHANLACNKCHLNHGDSPQCTGCHASHAESMGEADCQNCHAPHNPLSIRYFASISASLCGACHEEVAAQLQESGAAHKDKVGCFRCHSKHPPQKDSAPAACASCHAPADNDHFALADCKGCHAPHAPLSKPLAEMKDVGAACVTCHPQPGADMELAADAHSQQACIDCHDTHGLLPDCRQCHEPHSEAMTRGDCQKCHAPHAPSAIRFDEKIGSALCGACHEAPTSLLAKSGAAHQEVGCAGCHQEHGSVPACGDCHAASDQAHFAVKGCAGCHAPHAPLVKDLARLGDVRPACVSCHEGPGADADAFPSVHSEMACNECHLQHGKAMSCLECHEPHTPAMSYADCLRCHAPHKPTQADFSGAPSTALCATCHQSQVDAIDQRGGAHRSEVSCADCHGRHPGIGCTNCHARHPEAGVAAKISCASCHAPADKPHFALGGCAQCHPPHSPLEVNLEAFDPVKPACLSCHGEVGAELLSVPSAHNAMDCTECHQKHGEYLSCLDCHQPHAKEMSHADCLRCHAPHQPTALAYPSDVPGRLCGACHGDEAGQIEKQGAAHKTKASCAVCHPQHKPNGEKTILTCRSCHPRLKKLHYTSEPCMPCHNPHAPLEVNLESRKEVKTVCVSCHSVVGRFMEFNPSRHSAVDCRECHQKHGEFKDCLACHQPHSKGMTYADCLRCHSPHKPTDIAFAREVNPAHCSSCHKEVAAKIESKGQAHKSRVSCVSCHKAHPPKGDEVIPECSKCHDPGKKSHYRVKGCVGCHDPHAPFELDFSKVESAKPACLSCHAEVDKAMQAAPSKHLEVDCSRCHADHGSKKSCDSCHAPHTPKMTAKDCLACHPAHTPTRVSFKTGLSSEFCAACHGDVAGMLAATKAKHRKLNCTSCHLGDHGSAMTCADCHGQPHEPGLHSKFPDCLKCHENPHQLANWRAQ